MNLTVLEVLVVLNSVLSMASILIAITRNKKHDDSKTAKEMATLINEVKTLGKQIDGLVTLYDRLAGVTERVTSSEGRIKALEDACKNKHRSIDRLEAKVFGVNRHGDAV